MQEISITALFEQFDASVHEAMLAAVKSKQVTHLVIFENQALDSTHCGDRSVLTVGPGCTYENLEALQGVYLGDLPSQRKYPVSYVVVSKDYAAQAMAASNWGKPAPEPEFNRIEISRKPKGEVTIPAEDLTKRQKLIEHYQNLPQRTIEDRTFDKIRPCTLFFDRRKYTAIDLTLVYDRGTPKERSARQIVCIGEKPKHTRAHVVYDIVGEPHEWYLAGHYDSDEPNAYNPVGKTFMLHPWDLQQRIDYYEPRLRPKITVYLSYIH